VLGTPSPSGVDDLADTAATRTPHFPKLGRQPKPRTIRKRPPARILRLGIQEVCVLLCGAAYPRGILLQSWGQVWKLCTEGVREPKIHLGKPHRCPRQNTRHAPHDADGTVSKHSSSLVRVQLLLWGVPEQPCPCRDVKGVAPSGGKITRCVKRWDSYRIFHLHACPQHQNTTTIELSGRSCQPWQAKQDLTPKGGRSNEIIHGLSSAELTGASTMHGLIKVPQPTTTTYFARDPYPSDSWSTTCSSFFEHRKVRNRIKLCGEEARRNPPRPPE